MKILPEISMDREVTTLWRYRNVCVIIIFKNGLNFGSHLLLDPKDAKSGKQYNMGD